MNFSFRPEKAIEALLYVAPRVRDSDMYLALKTLYLADKRHLSDYGRFIFGDWYCAMVYGPVGSNAYDIIKAARGDENASCGVAIVAEILRVAGNRLTPLRDANLGVLSATDIECLDGAIAEYGSLSFGQAKDESHDDAWKATDRNRPISTQAIAATMENAAELIQYLEERHSD